jgi:hypothetical protein
MTYLKQLLLAIFLTATTYAGVTDPNTKDEKYIEKGSEFPYVCLLIASDEKGSVYCGSCIMIDDHHILSAAHVVDNMEICIVVKDDKKFLLEKVFIHKDYNPKTFATVDLALGYSEKSFELDKYPELFTGRNETGKHVEVVGYGFTGRFYDKELFNDGNKRGGLNYIYRSKPEMIFCPFPVGSRQQKELGFFIQSGDSGGGLFIDGKLAGVNSFVSETIDTKTRKRYNKESGHTRVSSYIKWIEENKVKN